MGSDLDDMQAMVDSTLAYLRGDADPEPRQVANVVSVLMSIADASSDAGRDVTYAGPGRALATVRPVALRRALDNVVDNAVRYGTSARITLAVEPEELLLTVDDDGPGIATQDIARAFEPFTRLEASRNRNTGGTGLGLTIARRIVEGGGREHRHGHSTGGRPEGPDLPAARRSLTHFVTNPGVRMSNGVAISGLEAAAPAAEPWRPRS